MTTHLGHMWACSDTETGVDNVAVVLARLAELVSSTTVGRVTLFGTRRFEKRQVIRRTTVKPDVLERAVEALARATGGVDTIYIERAPAGADSFEVVNTAFFQPGPSRFTGGEHPAACVDCTLRVGDDPHQLLESGLRALVEELGASYLYLHAGTTSLEMLQNTVGSGVPREFFQTSGPLDPSEYERLNHERLTLLTRGFASLGERLLDVYPLNYFGPRLWPRVQGLLHLDRLPEVTIADDDRGGAWMMLGPSIRPSRDHGFRELRHRVRTQLQSLCILGEWRGFL